MSENHFDPMLEELKKRSIDRLLNADTFDASAFEALKEHLWRKAEGLQREYCISKQILFSLRSAISAIRSRAEYLSFVREQLHWADEFELMLDQARRAWIASPASPVLSDGLRSRDHFRRLRFSFGSFASPSATLGYASTSVMPRSRPRSCGGAICREGPEEERSETLNAPRDAIEKRIEAEDARWEGAKADG